MFHKLISLTAALVLSLGVAVPVLAAHKPPPAFMCNVTVSQTHNGVPDGSYTVSGATSDTNLNGQTEVLYSGVGYVLTASYFGCV